MQVMRRADWTPEVPYVTAAVAPQSGRSHVGIDPSQEEKTWHEAQANCMEMGMTLASIHNEQDQIAVMEASRGNGGWVGLTDDDHDAVNDHCPGAPGCGSSVSTAEGEWVFTDGTVIGNMDEARHWTPREGAFHNWASGEPGDSSVGEDCAYLKVSAAGLCLACICSSIGISSAVAQGTRSSTVCDMGAHTVSQQKLTAPLLPLPALDVACGLRRGAGTTSRAPTRRPASAGRSPRSTSRAARTCGCGSFDKAERQQEHWQYCTHHHTTTPPPSHSLTIDPNPSSLAAPVLQSLAAENFLNVRGATTRRFFYSFADTGARLARLRPWSYSLGLHV